MAKTFEGRRVSSPIENNKLFSPATPQFIYMHHPNTWDLVETADGYEVLPILTKFQLVAGLNGVKLRPGGGVDSTAARASFMDQGWVFIDEKKIDGGYVREFEGARGPIYMDKFTSPRVIGNSARGRVIWDTDKTGYNDFRRSLLEDGTIEAPDPSALDWKIELLEKRIDRKTKSSHIPKVQKEVEKATEEKDALIEAKTTKKTTVKRKRAPRKKTPAVKS
jgi:hypothetical protein